MAETSNAAKSGLSNPALEALSTLSARAFSFDFKPCLPSGKTAALLSAIDHKLSDSAAPVVHFTSIYAGANARTVALEVACAAAANRRVLFISWGGRISGKMDGAAGMALDRFVKAGESDGLSPFSVVGGSSLFHARFSEAEGNGEFPLSAALARALFGRLKTMFDLVIVHSESALSGGNAVTLTSLADGTILILEAERTRIPVAAECRNMLEAGGGRVIGTVLTGRRHHIPHWLYNLLFKAQKA